MIFFWKKMCLLAGILFSLLICESVSQGQRFRDGDGFRGGPPGTDMMARGREGFGSGGQFGGGGGGGSSGPMPVVGECPRDRRIEGFRCYGRGSDVTDCPSGSTCMSDGTATGSFCCWESSSPVQSPCDDPMMERGTFVQCTPGEASRACPGSCHSCRSLGGGLGMGLCCPEINRRGCENSSPMRNEFEAARRRITGSPGETGSSTSMNTDTRFADRGQGSPTLGTDFGMTRSGISDAEGRRVLCPNGFPPVQSCSATTRCGFDQVCLEISPGRGGCCTSDRSGFRVESGSPGSSRASMGRGDMMGLTGEPGSGALSRTGIPSMTGMRGESAGVAPGMPGRPGMSPIAGMPGEMGGFDPRVMGRSGMPGIPPAVGRFGSGAMGGPGGMPGRRIPMELLARRREMMRRALARRRMLASRAPFPRGPPF